MKSGNNNLLFGGNPTSKQMAPSSFSVKGPKQEPMNFIMERFHPKLMKGMVDYQCIAKRDMIGEKKLKVNRWYFRNWCIVPSKPQNPTVLGQVVCNTEVCLTFLRLAAKLSEMIAKFRGRSLKIQHRSYFDLNGLKNGPSLHFKNSICSKD